MYFAKRTDRPSVTTDTGTTLTLLASDDNLTMIRSEMPAGRIKKPHQHAAVQAYLIVSGKMELQVGEESMILEAGDSCIVPSMVPHGAKILEPTTEIEIFHPARPELVKKHFPQYAAEHDL